MKIVQVEQGTADWIAWRRTRRMASFAPAVMQASSYMSERDVIGFYLNGTQQFVSPAMAYGRQMEPNARKEAAGVVGELLFPTCVESGEYGASLDGLTDDGNIAVECKCPYGGKESQTWINIARYASPGEHMWQIQQQLMVSGATKLLYLVWTPDAWLHLWIEPDKDRQGRLTAGWDAVWAKVLAGRPLERADEAWQLAADRFASAKLALDAAERQVKAAQNALVALCTSEREEGCGVVVKKVARKGAIDYARVPQLVGVDLEPFRKAGTAYWQVDMKGKE